MVGESVRGNDVIYRESSEALLKKDNWLVKDHSSCNDLSQIRWLGFCIKKRKERKMRFVSVHSDKRNIKAGNWHHHADVSTLF